VIVGILPLQSTLYWRRGPHLPKAIKKYKNKGNKGITKI